MDSNSTPVRFWTALSNLVWSATLKVDRPKGSRHPRYPDRVYPLDYMDTWKGRPLQTGRASTSGLGASQPGDYRCRVHRRCRETRCRDQDSLGLHPRGSYHRSPLPQRWLPERTLAAPTSGHPLSQQATKTMESYRELVGNLHVHSVYSDGSGTYREIAAAAAAAQLNFVIVTDHNVRPSGLEGFHDQTLVLSGEELHNVRSLPRATICSSMARARKWLPIPSATHRHSSRPAANAMGYASLLTRSSGAANPARTGRYSVDRLAPERRPWP